MIRPDLRSAIQVIACSVLASAVCLSSWLAADPAWGETLDRTTSASSGRLAGRTSEPPADQTEPTREPAAGEVSQQHDGSPSATETPQPASEPKASQRSPNASAKKAAPSPLARSTDFVADWDILFADGFENNVNHWDAGIVRMDAVTMSRTVADGTYSWEMEVRKPLSIWSEPASGLLSDFYAAVDASPSADTSPDVEFGLSLRSGDPDDMLLFLASPARGVTLLRGLGDSPQVLVEWTPASDLQNQTWNRLAISSVGSEIALYVNDRQIEEVTGEALSGAQPGIVVRAGEAGHFIAQFDNFEVRPAPGSTVIGPGLAGDMISPPFGEIGWARVLSGTHRTGPPDWPITFWDEFDDNGNGWATGEEFNRQMEATRSVAGTFAWQFKALQPVLRSAEVPHPATADFYAGVDAKRYSGPEDVWYGLSVQQSDPNRAFFFLVNDDQNYRVSAVEGDSHHRLVDSMQSDAIRRSEPNNLGVMAEANRLAFFVNHQPVIELEIESPSGLSPERTLGLVLGPGEGDTGIMEFDNFELRVRDDS